MEDLDAAVGAAERPSLRWPFGDEFLSGVLVIRLLGVGVLEASGTRRSRSARELYGRREGRKQGFSAIADSAGRGSANCRPIAFQPWVRSGGYCCRSSPDKAIRPPSPSPGGRSRWASRRGGGACRPVPTAIMEDGSGMAFGQPRPPIPRPNLEGRCSWIAYGASSIP